MLARCCALTMAISCRMRWVVMDEADLLMGGGYLRDVNKIMSLMQQDDSRIKAEVISARLGISIDDFNAKPRLERKTALQGATRQAHSGSCYKLPLKP